MQTEAIPQYQTNHTYSQPERLPQIPGHRGLTYPSPIIHRNLHERDAMSHHFHQQLRTEMRASNGEVRPDKPQRVLVEQAISATHVSEDSGVEKQLRHLGHGPVPPAQEATHISASPDEVLTGA